MRLAVYAHFDANNHVAEHVHFYLRELKALGFDIYFVSNSPLSASSMELLEKNCSKIVTRPNVGFDFGMWQHAIKNCDFINVEELLLTNSSIIGPLSPLQNLWEMAAKSDCDFWGLTDNSELTWHLQSYFLVFRKAVLKSAAFGQFWESILPYSDKDQIIRSYEVGLTVWLEGHHFRRQALYSAPRICARFNQLQSPVYRFRERARKRMLTMLDWRNSTNYWINLLARILYSERHDGLKNVTIFFPDVLMREGMPFFKLELLRSGNKYFSPPSAFRLLKDSPLSIEIMNELRSTYHLK